MELEIQFALSCVKFLLIGVFVFSSYRLYHAKSDAGLSFFVILGMLIGALSGHLMRFNHDINAELNYSAWWFFPTVLFALIGAVLGMLVFVIVKNRGRF